MLHKLSLSSFLGHKYINIYIYIFLLFIFSCDGFPEPELCIDPESTTFVEPIFNFNLPEDVINTIESSICWERNEYCGNIEFKAEIFY